MDNDEAVRLRRIVVRLARTFNGFAIDEGLAPSQASILGLLDRRGPLTIADAARLENLNASMTSRVVGALVGKDLITRTPDPNDRRSATLAITRKGRAAFNRVRNQRTRAIQDAAEQLTPDQHAALLAALPALEALAPRVE